MEFWASCKIVVDLPIYVIVAFWQKKQLNQQHRNIETIYRPTVVNSQCFIVIKKHRDAGIDCIHAIDTYSQAKGEIVYCLNHLA